MIMILDYGMGNCGSIKNMLRYLGVDAMVVSNPEYLQEASAIILPGVGSYDHGLMRLEPFRAKLEEKVLHDQIPFLGICLGMQLLLERSEEGKLPGLAWIEGEVKRFHFSPNHVDKRLVVPHMGWNNVDFFGQSKLLRSEEMVSAARFYFVHSYHAASVPRENQIARCEYGYSFTCGIQKNNIYGVQFHPEKSHKFGKQLFSQFVELIQCKENE